MYIQQLTLRVSFIEYLNALPLGWGFLHGSERGAFRVLKDVPSRCAARLASGEAEVGLIPVIEYQRIAGLRILPRLAIAARGEVKSVLFLARKPLAEIQRVALDSASRTSAALLQILLNRFWRHPGVEFVSQEADLEAMLARCQGALLIGDPALHVARRRYRVFDLAAEWHRFTGLPFVFAFWAVREGVDLGGQAEIFERSLAEGLDSVDEIARLWSPRLRLKRREIRHYLLHHLDYRLEDSALRGLERYYTEAHRLGLIKRVRPLRFYQGKTRLPAIQTE